MNTLALRRLVECALLVAVGTVLSLIQFPGPWVLGGSITLCSMLPLVMISKRHGLKWGVLSAFAYSLIQLLLGLNNVQYAPDALTAIGIIMLDYVLAFTVIGFSGCFGRVVRNPRTSLVVGVVVTFTARLVCHFLSGILIWEAIYPNEHGIFSVVWSIAYNGSFMLPEMVLTIAVILISYKPLKRFWLGEDLTGVRA